MDSRPAPDGRTPERDEQARRQVRAKCVGKTGSAKISVTKYQIEMLLGAHEENKRLRQAYAELRTAHDKQHARLLELEPEPEDAICKGCGKRLLDGKHGKVCGSPTCPQYGVIGTSIDEAENIPEEVIEEVLKPPAGRDGTEPCTQAGC